MDLDCFHSLFHNPYVFKCQAYSMSDDVLKAYVQHVFDIVNLGPVLCEQAGKISRCLHKWIQTVNMRNWFPPTAPVDLCRPASFHHPVLQSYKTAKSLCPPRSWSGRAAKFTVVGSLSGRRLQPLHRDFRNSGATLPQSEAYARVLSTSHLVGESLEHQHSWNLKCPTVRCQAFHARVMLVFAKRVSLASEDGMLQFAGITCTCLTRSCEHD